MKHRLLYNQRNHLPVVRRENAALTHDAVTSIQPEESAETSFYKRRSRPRLAIKKIMQINCDSDTITQTQPLTNRQTTLKVQLKNATDNETRHILCDNN